MNYSQMIVEKINVPNKKLQHYDTTIRQSVIYNWLIQVSSIPWFISDQTLAPPQIENVTRGYIRIVDISRTGQDGVFYTQIPENQGLNIETYAFRTITFTLDVYSIDQSANYVLQKVLTYVKEPTTIEFFVLNNFGFIKYSDIRNFCLQSSGRWLNRYQADIKFNILDNVFTTIDSIAKAPFEGIYD